MTGECGFKKCKRSFVNFWSGMVRNTLCQSDFGIFKLALFHEQLHQSAWFVYSWCRLKEGKMWFEKFWLSETKIALSQSDHRILKTTISQKIKGQPA